MKHKDLRSMKRKLKEILQNYRYTRGWTQQQLADLVGVNVSVVSAVETFRGMSGYSLWKFRRALPEVDEWARQMDYILESGQKSTELDKTQEKLEPLPALSSGGE